MPKVWELVVRPRLSDSPVQRVILFPEDQSVTSVAMEFSNSPFGQWAGRGTLLDCYSDWCCALNFRSSFRFFMLVGITSISACEVTDPDMLFDGCVDAGAAYMESNQTKDISCALNADTVLVAIPARPPTENELVRKGLPQMAAEMLSESEAPGSRWCFLPPEQRPARSHSVCVESKIRVEQLFVGRGPQVRLTLKRVREASVSVTNVSTIAGSQ